MTPGIGRVQLDRCAVIGDVHGSAHQLATLLEQLDGRPIVSVGDVCDRGPHSRGVIDLLVRHGAVGVRGNHEEWLIRWVSGQGFDPFALHPRMGGVATLQSYGIQGAPGPREHLDVPPAHRDWLAALPVALDLRVGDQDWWVLHAGVPGSVRFAGVPKLVRSHRDRLLWEKTPPHRMRAVDRPVVMGHVPLPIAEDHGHVVAIDTGCGTFGPDGVLTALLLPERVWVEVPAS